MQPNMTPFAYGDHMVRSFLDEQGEPWFVAKDVCRVLELENSRQALSYLDEDEKGVIINDTLGGPQQMSTVSEPGMYALVFRSRKPPRPARFQQRVVTSVVTTLTSMGVAYAA